MDLLEDEEERVAAYKEGYKKGFALATKMYVTLIEAFKKSVIVTNEKIQNNNS